MSLYQNYRPMDLSEVKGQDSSITILKGMIKNGTMPHAFLFVGTRGTGKTSVARITARIRNCEHPGESGPCNQCESCLSALQESNLDIMEIDAASRNKVEDIEQLLDSCKYVAMNKEKVYILDEVHMLTTGAFNKLLKTLEEPPKNCTFILCTTELAKVPATIISRCMLLNFEKIQDSVILDQLKFVCDKEGYTYDLDGLSVIAKAADGGLRDALSILEKFAYTEINSDSVLTTLGMATDDIIFSLLAAIHRKDSMIAISSLKEVLKSGKGMGLFNKQLIDALLDIVYVIQNKGTNGIINTKDYIENISVLAKEMSADECLSNIQKLAEVYAVAKYASIDFAMEVTVLQMIDISQDNSRLDELEDQVLVLTQDLVELQQTVELFKQEGVTVCSDVVKETKMQEEPVQEISFVNTCIESDFSEVEDDEVPFEEVPLTSVAIKEEDPVLVAEEEPKLVALESGVVAEENVTNVERVADMTNIANMENVANMAAVEEAQEEVVSSEKVIEQSGSYFDADNFDLSAIPDFSNDYTVEKINFDEVPNMGALSSMTTPSFQEKKVSCETLPDGGICEGTISLFGTSEINSIVKQEEQAIVEQPVGNQAKVEEIKAETKIAQFVEETNPALDMFNFNFFQCARQED